MRLAYRRARASPRPMCSTSSAALARLIARNAGLPHSSVMSPGASVTRLTPAASASLKAAAGFSLAYDANKATKRSVRPETFCSYLVKPVKQYEDSVLSDLKIEEFTHPVVLDRRTFSCRCLMTQSECCLTLRALAGTRNSLSSTRIGLRPLRGVASPWRHTSRKTLFTSEDFSSKAIVCIQHAGIGVRFTCVRNRFEPEVDKHVACFQ